MPVLTYPRSILGEVLQAADLVESIFEGPSPAGLGLIRRCANQECSSGFLHLFRNRFRPIFEGGWTCSPECTEARVQMAVRRELEGRTSKPEAHRHRVPLGLLMLEKGWITRQQLRAALEAQRVCGRGRLGEWLVKQHATDEATVTRALSVQWSCPVLSLDPGAPGTLTSVMPRLFIDATGVLPLRVVAGKILYLGFEESPNPVLALALERMTGLRVETGIVPSSIFRPSLREVLGGRFARIQLAEASSESAAAHLMAKAVERARSVDAKLVRVHDFLWMRLFQSHQRSGVPAVTSVSDVVCTIKTF
jgi:Type II secretion system (T2SS), protein E, N-terminal domain